MARIPSKKSATKRRISKKRFNIIEVALRSCYQAVEFLKEKIASLVEIISSKSILVPSEKSAPMGPDRRTLSLCPSPSAAGLGRNRMVRAPPLKGIFGTDATGFHDIMDPWNMRSCSSSPGVAP